MKHTRLLLTALTGICLLQTGWILGVSGFGLAHAEPTDTEDALTTQDADPLSYSTPFKCRHFPVEARDRAQTIETADRTSEVGQWVGEQEDNGWGVYSVDFEVGTKSTGFSQGWVQVCVIPS